MTAKTAQVTTEEVSFDALPGWAADDHLAAWKAFLISCEPVLKYARVGAKTGKSQTPEGLIAICELAQIHAKAVGKMTGADARTFFETHFRPHRVEQSVTPGLLTGYYEPLIKGARTPSADFAAPLYKRPDDLVNVVPESERGAKSHQLTHMQRVGAALQPYPTRADIEKGALKGRNLELLYFRDPVDVYFLQVQGSARVELPDGSQIRITYDGKNGHPYTSIGRELIADGTFTPDNMSLKALANWLKADRKRAEPVMWKNQSYVFFRELTGQQSQGAMGALSIPLQVGRSLAVDTAFHALGTPIYVAAPDIRHATKSGGFNRLMIAHDVGSAIKGPERGDIFFGSGDAAGKKAGVTKHAGHFYVLKPSTLMASRGGTTVARQSP
ncbi:MAG: murein transglycosylase A [Hyphomicrobium sp.]